ncbi:MAG TPA: hypothetical protein P5150_03955 [Candidatus Ratteibacteria bacterium]|nr:hypothetical protein [Candidatus Ratteibacteria bacterium]
MKLKLPLITAETPRERYRTIEFRAEKVFFAMKDVSKKHSLYFIPIETEPYTALIDTLGRYLWGVNFKKQILFFGAVKFEKEEGVKKERVKIFLPEFAPVYAKELIDWVADRIVK